MKDLWDNKTTEQKVVWLKAFFTEYPLKKKIDFRQKTDSEIDDLYYQYQSHCAIHQIKMATTTLLGQTNSF